MSRRLKPTTRALLKQTAKLKKRHIAQNVLTGNPSRSAEVRKFVASALRFNRKHYGKKATTKSYLKGTI